MARGGVNENLGRWGVALALGVIVGVAIALALSPSFGSAATWIGAVAALAVALGVLKRQPELLDK